MPHSLEPRVRVVLKVFVVSQVIAGLHETLQTAVVVSTNIPFNVLVCILPDSMLAPLVLCNYTFEGTLDLSKQLRRCPWEQSSAQCSAPPVTALKSPLAMLGGYVSSLQNLRHLLLDDNGFTLKDASLLATILTCQASSLQTLSLEGRNQGLFTQRGGRILWPPLLTCRSLTRLDLSYNSLAASALTTLLPAVGSLCSLHALSLRACSLRDEQAEVLCYAVRNLVALTKLDLGQNSLEHTSFLQLAQSVPQMRALADLDVSQTNPDVLGLGCLLAAALSTPNMQSFNAEGCKVYSWVPQPRWPSPRVTRCTAEQLLYCCLSAMREAEERSSSLRDGIEEVTSGSCHDQSEPCTGEKHIHMCNNPASIEMYQDPAATYTQAKNVRNLQWPQARGKACLPGPSSQMKQLNLDSALGSYLGPLSELISLSLTNLVTVKQDGHTSIERADTGVQSESGPTSMCRWKPVDMLSGVESLDLGATSFLQVPSFLLSPFFGSFRCLQDLNLQAAAFDQGALWDVFHTLGQKISRSAVVGLTSLYLSNHPMTAGELVAVCRVCTLRRLTLKQCVIGPRKVGLNLTCAT